MINYAEIDNVLYQFALLKRFRFNAHQIAYATDVREINEVYDYLLSKTPYILEQKFEVNCPNDHSIISLKSPLSIPTGWVECRICGEEFIPDPNHIHIVFNFKSEYLNKISEIDDKKKYISPALV